MAILLGSLALTANAEANPENLARKATVTTSFVNEANNLLAVNDSRAYRPARATADQYYSNWNGPEHFGETNWVEYELPFKAQLTNNMIYWYYNDSINLPSSAYLEYWDIEQSQWVRSIDVDTLADRYNSDNTLTQVTNKVRMYMTGATATGIIEWQLWGYQLCDTAVTITPTYQINDGEIASGKFINAETGDKVAFIPEAVINSDEESSWSWTGPSKFKATGKDLVLENVSSDNNGVYTLTYTNICEDKFTQTFSLCVSELPKGALYDWPQYTPNLQYDFRSEYPTLQAPTKILPDNNRVVGTITKGWWAFRWGPNKRQEVTEEAIDKLLDRMNTDFAYFRDVMGWPPDDRAKNGYYSTVYLYGSGLGDGADTTALGGWQSAYSYDGKSWPMVLISYYPVASFDPNCKYSDRETQKGGVVHEGIHSVLAGLPGAKNSAWFQEGGNTWLQQQYEAKTANDFSEVGWLNGGPFVAPFMPIECYSGWLQDDSFGGPSAEGVNMYNSSGTQLCTWRNYIGGLQYANSFPCCIGEIIGEKCIPWIWRYCPGRVLEGIADSIGEKQMRRMIMEYRAKQATFDLGKWSSAFRKITSSYFNIDIKQEYSPYWQAVTVWKSSPYAITTDDGTGWLTPEYRTTPGWSGANQIPLKVTGDTCSVIFEPLGDNMSCQLVYRSTSGYAYYSEPVLFGECTLSMPEAPSNGIVIAVICNTDYIYKGEETRKAHFNYRLKMGKNVTGKAATNTAWFNKWTLQAEKNPYVGIETVREATNDLTFSVKNSVVTAGENIYIDYSREINSPIEVTLVSASGVLCKSYKLSERGYIQLPANLSKGFYLLQCAAENTKQSTKLVVK